MLPEDPPAAFPPAAGLVIPGRAGVPVPVNRLVERRGPQIERRSVLPVEFFRRMPGGGTTYAPTD